MRCRPLDDPPVVLRSEAIEFGLDDAELARRVRAAELIRLRRGAYLASTDAIDLDPTARHRLDIVSTWAQLDEPAIVSHGSAATLLGIPMFDVPLDRVCFTRTPPSHGRQRPGVLVLVAQLDEGEAVECGAMQVTSPARTALDLTRRHGMRAGVVAADHLLRHGQVQAHELAVCAANMFGTPGSRAVNRVVAFADGRSESVGESLSRVVMAQAGLPAPQLQLPVVDAGGLLIARCDFGYAERRVVGEFDGQIKYGRLLRPGETPGQAVFREKQREDAVRDCGWEMVRWTWQDIFRPHPLIDRWERALRRADRRRWL